MWILANPSQYISILKTKRSKYGSKFKNYKNMVRISSTHILVFLTTFLSQAARHIGIMGWSMIKSDLLAFEGFTGAQLGTIDTVYLIFYALGNILSGQLSDSYSPRCMISIGLGVTCFLYIMIVILSYLNINLFIPSLIIYMIIGLSHSTVWPATVSIMGNWFDKSIRGRVFGIWCCANSVGQIIACYLCILVVQEFGGSW